MIENNTRASMRTIVVLAASFIIIQLFGWMAGVAAWCFGSIFLEDK